MTDRPLSASKRSWYDWAINFAASIVLVLFWWGGAWVGHKLWGGRQEDCFLMIVAVSVALNLPATRVPR